MSCPILQVSLCPPSPAHLAAVAADRLPAGRGGRAGGQDGAGPARVLARRQGQRHRGVSSQRGERIKNEYLYLRTCRFYRPLLGAFGPVATTTTSLRLRGGRCFSYSSSSPATGWRPLGGAMNAFRGGGAVVRMGRFIVAIGENRSWGSYLKERIVRFDKRLVLYTVGTAATAVPV